MKQIVNFLKQCPCLADKKVCEDFLAAESGSIAVVPDGGDRILKKYTSGDLLGQISVKILMRSFFTGEANRIFEQIIDWIGDESTNLPELCGDKVAQYFEIAEAPLLIKTEVNAGVYEMKLKLIYYRKGVKNE